MAGLIEGVVGWSGGGTTDRRVGAVKGVNGTGTKERKVDTPSPLDLPPYTPPDFLVTDLVARARKAKQQVGSGQLLGRWFIVVSQSCPD